MSTTPDHLPDASKMPTPEDYTRDLSADLAIQQAATPGDWIAWQAKSCPASISPEPFGEVIGVPRVYADKTQYFRPGDAVAIAAAHNNAPAWLRRLIAAEEAILAYVQARTDPDLSPDGLEATEQAWAAASEVLFDLAAQIRAGQIRAGQKGAP